ncbi:MAG: hypothetical protein ACON31_12080 [Candidatus Puniceispirillaceae bacterium]
MNRTDPETDIADAADGAPTDTAADAASEVPPADPPLDEAGEQPETPPAELRQPREKRAGAGTGAGRSDAPQTAIGAQDSAAINANLAGLAAGTVRLDG